MTHSFNFNYHGRVYYFVWDKESGSLHNVDYVAFLVVKHRFGEEMTDQEKLDYSKLDTQEIKETNSELDELVAQGVLDSPCTIKQNMKRYGEVKALCLHICHDCNMRCKYCFADEGTYHTSDRAYMSLEVGCKAVDFLIEHSGHRKSLEIDFFGGEPLLNLNVVKGIVKYARSREAETGKTFNFTMTTNCLLLGQGDTIDWLNKEMHNVVLSIDGRPDIHNAVRTAPGGKPVYDIILKNAQDFRAVRGDKSYYVRGTFTAKNLDFSKDVLALNDAGFDQISIEPVVTDIPDLAIRKEHLPQILREYEKLAVEYIDRRKTDKWFNFFHFMIDLEGGPCIIKRLTGCGSGCEYLSVTPNGNIFPCHQFAEVPEYLMGNVFDGEINFDVSREFAKNIVCNKPECQNCIAKYYCSGGCAANNLNFGGNLHGVYDISCAMMRKRFELSLAIAAIEGAQQGTNQEKCTGDCETCDNE